MESYGDLSGFNGFAPNVEQDYYRSARDSCLKKLLPDYPDIGFHSFLLSFAIRSTAKNGDIVYAIVDSFPPEICSINVNEIRIAVDEERYFTNNLQQIIDVLCVIWNWSSVAILFNNVVFTCSEFRYLCHYYEDCLQSNLYWKSVREIKERYIIAKKKPRKKTAQVRPKLELSNQKHSTILENTIQRYLDIYGDKTSNQLYPISENETILVIEDSVVVDFCLHAKSWRKDDGESENEREWSFPQVIIQDLTLNEIYKFNYAGFKNNFFFSRVSMDYFKFSGVGATDWSYNRFGTVDQALPFLDLQHRLDNYSGETYHFVILIMEDCEGNKKFGIGYTKGLIHSFVQKVCSELENKNSRLPELSCLPYRENIEFMQAFLSWKGQKKRWRLENKFAYYFLDRQIKRESDLYSVPNTILELAKKEEYCGELGYYTKPINRWKSEELVYNIVKKLYNDYLVIYQYRPPYLSTESGSMSYDIYICGLKVAIEYQGKQHFEPVEYFGGKENHEKQKQRDKLKAELSKKNGVKLVYINYWESITPELIKKRVEE